MKYCTAALGLMVAGGILTVSPAEAATLDDAVAWLDQIGMTKGKKPYTAEILQDLTSLSVRPHHEKKEAYREADLSVLAALPKLTSLNLESVKPGDAACQLVATSLPDIERLSLGNSPITDQGLAALSGLQKLKQLQLNSCQEISDAGMASVAKLPSMSMLNLDKTTISNAGLEHLGGGCPKLLALSLIGNKTVTGEGLVHLAKLPALSQIILQWTVVNSGLENLAGSESIRDLTLMDCGLNDESLAGLAQVKTLTKIAIWHNPEVTDAGLAHVAELPNLRTLIMSKCGVTDAGLKHLTGLENLQTIWMDDIPLTDAGCETLAQLPALRSLTISNSQVTDAGLLALAKAPSLNSITARKTQITDDGIAAFQEVKPKGRVAK